MLAITTCAPVFESISFATRSHKPNRRGLQYCSKCTSSDHGEAATAPTGCWYTPEWIRDDAVYCNIRYPDAFVLCSATPGTATVFTRINGLGASVVVEGDVALPMPEIGVSVPLAELYADVGFRPMETPSRREPGDFGHPPIMLEAYGHSGGLRAAAQTAVLIQHAAEPRSHRIILGE